MQNYQLPMFRDKIQGKFFLIFLTTFFNTFLEKLDKFEIPKKIKLCKEAWTPETDLVTQSLKLKRRNIATFYAQSIKAMYT